MTREIAQRADSLRCVCLRHMRPHLRKLTARGRERVPELRIKSSTQRRRSTRPTFSRRRFNSSPPCRYFSSTSSMSGADCTLRSDSPCASAWLPLHLMGGPFCTRSSASSSSIGKSVRTMSNCEYASSITARHGRSECPDQRRTAPPDRPEVCTRSATHITLRLRSTIDPATWLICVFSAISQQQQTDR